MAEIQIILGSIAAWLILGFIAWMMAVNQLHGVLNRKDKDSPLAMLVVPRRYKMIAMGLVSLFNVLLVIVHYPKQQRHWGLRVSLY